MAVYSNRDPKPHRAKRWEVVVGDMSIRPARSMVLAYGEPVSAAFVKHHARLVLNPNEYIIKVGALT